MSIYVSWRKRLVALGLALWLLVGLLGSAPWASFGQGPPSPEVVGEAPRTPSPAPTTAGQVHARGYVPPPVDLSHLDGRWRVGPQLAQLPGSWDWRAEGKVTGVQDQGDCGSCYAFATLGSFESQLLITGEGSYDLSEMHATHCHYEALNPYVGYDSGCDGGNIWMVTNLYSAQGASLEACDPYTVTESITCTTTCPLTETVTDMWVLAGPSVPPTETLKSWLHNYGPLYVAMDSGGNDPLGWGSEFGAYKEGSDTLYEPMDEPNLDHAVLLVGWDDDLPHDGGSGGWIAKNSWGTGWGGTCGFGSEKGYFTIAYGSAGIGSSASLIKGWQDYDPDGSLLYNDEAGMQGFLGYGTTTAWGLARLTPGEDGCATQVEIWTSDATTVTVSIYDDFDGDAPSGPLWSSESNTFDHAGYHSIPILRRLPLSAGDDVSVVVRVENDSSKFPLPVDSLGPVSADQSFASGTGEQGPWLDLADRPRPLDIGIRLRVAPCPECKIYLPAVLKEWAPATPP